MRKTMLEAPGFPERINRETVPVLLNTTDVGFPDDIPCLKWFSKQYYSNPWIRMIYGFNILINPDGTKYYGSSGCQCTNHNTRNVPYQDALPQFNATMKRWYAAHELERKARLTGSEKKRLKKIYVQAEKQIQEGQVCGDDMRLLTARYLTDHGSEKWDIVLGQLLTPKPGQNMKDPLGKRMRLIATRCLGDIIVDESKFDQRHIAHLKAVYTNVGPVEYQRVRNEIVKRKGNVPVYPSDFPIPPSLIKIAAVSLGKIVEQNWRSEDPKVVEKARAWWKAHQGDARFHVGPPTIRTVPSVSR